MSISSNRDSSINVQNQKPDPALEMFVLFPGVLSHNLENTHSTLRKHPFLG